MESIQAEASFEVRETPVVPDWKEAGYHLPIQVDRKVHEQTRLVHFIYVCFRLRNMFLTRAMERRLEELGVECLMDGEPYRAYGIVQNSSLIERALRGDSDIISVEEAEPLCCK